MKVNLFSPLPPARSGIADYLWSILPHLRELADVTLWTIQNDWEARLEKYCRVKKVGDRIWEELHQADMTIYNIGNSAEFHGEIWDISRRHPGVVVLHDLSLQHLFAGTLLHYQNNVDAYLQVMGRYYGEDGREAAQRLVDHRATPEELATRYPLTPLVLERCLGVLVHSRGGFDTLRVRGKWPITMAALPYSPKKLPKTRAATVMKRGVHRLIVFGHLGPNRRIEALLTSLSQLEKPDQYRLAVYGRLWERPRLERMCEALGLAKIVRFHGFVPEATLRRALRNSDLAINLRYPTMGEASLSQLLIWEHALPSLVTKGGWYSELPGDVVAFVHQERESQDIKSQLMALVSQPAAFIRMGRRGRRFLEEVHSPKEYAKILVDLAARAAVFREKAAAFWLAEQLGSKIGLWASPEARRIAGRRAARTLISLFGVDESRSNSDRSTPKIG